MVKNNVKSRPKKTKLVKKQRKILTKKEMDDEKGKLEKLKTLIRYIIGDSTIHLMAHSMSLNIEYTKGRNHNF